jgi:hypothetical protein
MLANVLAALGIWFGASVVLGIFVGRLIAAHERTRPWAQDAEPPSAREAA